MEQNSMQAPIAPTPVVQTAPVTTGQLEGPVSLLKSSWEFYKANWKILTAIAVAPIIVMDVAQLLFRGNFIAIILGFILVIIALVGMISMQPAAINAIQKLSTEPGVMLSLKDQYKFGLGYFWSLILLVIIQTLVGLGSAIFFLIPAIVVGLYIGLYIFARVLDDKKGFAALLESYSLIRGRWWPVFARFLFIGLISAIVAAIIAVIITVIASLTGSVKDSMGLLIIGMIFNLILSGVLGALTSVYTYKLYVSLKATRTAMVDTGAFKKWLIFFMVVGVLVLIMIPILFTMVIGALGLRALDTLNGSNYGVTGQFQNMDEAQLRAILDQAIANSSSTDLTSSPETAN